LNFYFIPYQYQGTGNMKQYVIHEMNKYLF